MDPAENPVATCEVVKVEYSHKKGGTFVTFMISENPDNNYEGLAMLALGEVCQLYVTQKEQGL